MELTAKSSTDSEGRPFSLAESKLFHKSPSESQQKGKNTKDQVYTDPKNVSDAMYIDPKNADGMYIDPRGTAEPLEANQGISYTPLTAFNRDIYTQSQTIDDQTLYTDLTQSQDYESLKQTEGKDNKMPKATKLTNGTIQNNGGGTISEDMYSPLNSFEQEIYQ